MTSDVSRPETFPISQMLWRTFEKWHDDDIPRHAAVLAFYALFAVAPILLLCVEVLGLVYGRDVAEAQVLAHVTSFVNSAETGAWVNTFLHNILPSAANWWVTVGFVLALLYGASSFFNELKYVLNRIWDLPVPQDVNIGRFLWRRFQAVLMVLACSLLIFLGLLITSWISTATDWATLNLNLGSGYEAWSYLILVFVFLTIVFALIYKFVPDADVEWKDVWIGAAATALLLSVTRLLISLYFNYSYTTTMFGTASALVVILLSVFYATQIFFLGAEFTYVYSQLDDDEAAHPNELAAEQMIQAPVPRTLPPRQSGPVKLDIVNIAEEPKPAAMPIAEAEPEPETLSRFAKLRGRLPRLKFGKNRPTESPPEKEQPLPATNPSKTDAPITDTPKTATPSFFTRIKNIILIPIRILRPVRQLVVAVGVIFAISIAALSGIPFWRKRKHSAEPVDEEPS